MRRSHVSFPFRDNEIRMRALRERVRRLQPHRPFVLEAMEPRLLLSAVDPLTGAQAAAVNAGLAGLESWADTLNTIGLVTQQIPVINKSVDEALDIASIIQTKISNAVSSLGATPTPQQIMDKLNEGGYLGPGAVTINTADTSEVSFNVVYGYDGTVNTYLNVPNNDAGVSLDGPNPADATFNRVTLNTHLDLNFTFGINLTPGLAASESFFIRLNDTDGAGHLTGFNAGIDFSGALPTLQANVGILDVTAGAPPAASRSPGTSA